MISLRCLTFDDAERIRQWRNADLSPLRTPFLLTETMQEEWYRSVVSNRDARARWWAIGEEYPPPDNLIGYCGMENIEWENRRAEVSLLVSKDHRGHKAGSIAVGLLLTKAWNELNLDSVHGEVYECGPVGFWQKILPPATVWASVPMTKWWGGRYYGSQVFTVPRPTE